MDQLSLEVEAGQAWEATASAFVPLTTSLARTHALNHQHYEHAQSADFRGDLEFYRL
jgi:hypothetical protein